MPDKLTCNIKDLVKNLLLLLQNAKDDVFLSVSKGSSTDMRFFTSFRMTLWIRLFAERRMTFYTKKV